MDEPTTFCTDCVYHKTQPFYGWLFLPIIGLVLLFTHKNHICTKASKINFVTGTVKEGKGCFSARETKTSRDTNCINYLSKTTPLRNTADSTIMDEVMHRGLLKTMQNYKKSQDNA